MSLSWPERSRQERRFLRDCCPNYWGFAIYRTVYTPESDLLWEGTIAKLDEYVINSIWRYMGVTNLEVEEGEDQLDPGPTREVSARYRNLIMSDREKYDGASIDEVADHFTDWADDPNNDKSSNINMNVCLLIDEEVLHWLRDAPPATTEVRSTGDADQNVCIKVIDTLFDPEDMSECDPRYRGWALARLNRLWDLYSRVYSGDCPLSVQIFNVRSKFEGGVWWWILYDYMTK